MFRPSEEKKNDDGEQSESEKLLSNCYYQAGAKTNHNRSQHLFTSASSHYHTNIPQRPPRLLVKPAHSAIFVAILLLSSIFVVTERWIRLRKPLVDTHTNAIVQYDYIVVGAGPAGIIVATRIAKQLPDAQVLLLEAGKDSQSDVQKQLQKQHPNTQSQVQQQCLDNDDMLFVNAFDVPLLWSGVASGKRHHWPIELLGKTVGGSALFNAMIYVRSLLSDWKDVPGWNYTKLLSAYEQLETFTRKGWGNSKSNAYRGRGGPMATSQLSSVDALGPLFLESAEAVGYHLVDSFNTVDQDRSNTTGYYEFNIRNGVRDSVAQAFLGHPTSIPPNLRILTGVTVTRVLRLGGKSVGVEYVQGHHVLQFLLQPGGEVILSAGAIMSPQILANSGLNHTYHVQDHPVVTVGFAVDSAVALDAPSIYMLGTEFNDYFEATQALRTGTLNATDENNMKGKLGTLSSPGFSVGAFLRSPWSQMDAPDIQLTVFPRHLEPHVVLSSKHNHPAMLVTIALLHPEGRYRVAPSKSAFRLVDYPADEIGHLLHNDDDTNTWKRIFSYKLPSIELLENQEQYLTDLDVKRLAWGIKQVRHIQQRAPLSLHTGPEIYPAGNDLEDYIRTSHLTNSHWAGTTPIGSVVDERLRVEESLRVVDAGVLPTIPNGNIHSTVCAVAYLAADMIVQDRLARR